ncbi:hypothetical protein HRJ34_00280 [Rhizorhabdus wittichii]|uniref:Uncharacterized protein n=1 Tax=Rhizorhabdus wittichii TaxID=160791 RepID=A0A975D4A5_9SPHN|nr:hypothetical protein [Rhizorhabdus wittichii]QTH22016.1 hypothetical protein HRJ34_00280 [Rhizorhabdus wittichii]
MPTTAWKFPGTAINSVSGETGSYDWSNPGNIGADDGSYAGVILTGFGPSRTLRGSNFGFTSSDIPTGAFITGIEVKIERSASDANRINDTHVFIVPDGSAGSVSDRAGNNKADTATKWPTSDTAVIYGSSSDTWSAGLTRAQVLSSNFAIDFQATTTVGGLANVDYFQVRLTWELPTISAALNVTEAADALGATSAVKIKGAAALAEAGDTVYARVGYTALIDWDFTASETPDPRIVFSGEANATRVNSAGQIVAASAPRYNYNPVTLEPKGILAEESRTNYLIQSEFANGLPASRGGLLSTTTFAGLISGTGLAFGYDGTTSTYFYVTNYAVPASSPRVISVFVRMDDGGAPAFGSNGTHTPANDFVFNLGNLVLSPTTANGGKTEDYGGGLYRVSLAVTTIASPNSNCGVIKYNDNSPRTFKCSGIMVEAGLGPTSYIPTGATQVTRSAPSAIVSGGDFSAFWNGSAGTVIVDFDRLDPLDSTDRMAVEIDDGTSTNRLDMYVRTTGRAFGRASSVTSFDFSNLGAMAAGAPQKMALAFADNDFAASMNGSEPAVDTSGSVPAVNQLLIGMGHLGSPLNGHIRRLRYYDVRVRDSELKALTALQGRATVVEAGDTLAADAKAYIKAAVNKIEATDALTATAQVYVKAVVNKIEATDALSSAATVRIKGALARTEAGDTLSAAAKALIRATVTIGEAGDTLASAADAGPRAVPTDRRTIVLQGAPLSGRSIVLPGGALSERTITI